MPNGSTTSKTMRPGGGKNEQKEENENIKMDESDVSYLTRAINAVACFIRRTFGVGFFISICLSSFFFQPRCCNMTSSSPVGENNCAFGVSLPA